jgi:hypothetical protein
VQSDIGQIVKYKLLNFGINSSPQEIPSLDKNNGSYQAITLFPTVEATPRYATSVLLTRSNVQIRENITRFQNDFVLKTRNLNPPTLDTTSAATRTNTGALCLVFDYDDPLRNLMVVKGASELTLKPTFDAAPNGNLVAIAEVVGDVE